MKKFLPFAALLALSAPAQARIDEHSPIKSTRVVAMPVDKLTDCLTLSWGAPLLSTRYGDAGTRLGFAYMGNTFSVLLLTPVDGGTQVERQGNRIGEGHLSKCAGKPI